jgi:hypothetical protein
VTPRPSHDLPHEDWIETFLAGVLDQFEPVSDRARMLANEARQMSTVNEILAELAYDSAREGDLVATRGAEGETRLLSFTNDHVAVEIALLPDERSIVGELDLPATIELDIELADDSAVTVDVDEFGRFTATLPTEGAFRIRVPGRLITPWVRRY